MLDSENDPAVQPEVPAETTPTTVPADPPAETAETPETEAEPEPTETAEAPETHEIVLEGEEPAPAAPKDSAAWARMRKETREAQTRAADLERRLQALQAPQGAPEPGPEPTLAACEYDEERFKSELVKHTQAKARKAELDAQAAKQAQTAQQQMRALEDRYKTAKAELSRQVPDYAEAESAVIAVLSPAHQDALLKATDNAALVVGYIGKQPKLLEELGKEMDRDRFVAKLAKLEAKLKMSKKTSSTPPAERKISGAGPASGAADTKLEQLRATAAKTGDYTQVNAYKRNIARAGKK